MGTPKMSKGEERLIEINDSHHRLETELEQFGRRVRFNCYLTLIISAISAVFAFVVVALAHIVKQEVRFWVYLILGLLYAGCVLVLVLARNDSSILLLFTNLVTFVSGILLGLGTGFILPIH